MKTTQQLLQEIAIARQNYVDALLEFDEKQAQVKPSPEAWNAVEITEHLFWAEHGGILGMWKTLLGIRAGKVSYEENKPHEGLPIEDIIERTWKAKEEVPAVAAPRLGGSLAFWVSELERLQTTLERFGDLLEDQDLLLMAHPHPISGPMSFGQRLEFLRFHIDRHRFQVENLKRKSQIES